MTQYHLTLLSIVVLMLLMAAAVAEEGKAPEVPLRDVKITGAQLPKADVTPDGFILRNTGELSAEVACAPDSFLCRTGPAKNPDIVQLSIGQVQSLRCNALFSPSRDEAITFEAESVRLEGADGKFTVSARGPLTIRVDRDFMKVKRGMKWFKPLDKSAFGRAPAGWCTWYIYWQGITEDETIKNTDWLAANLKQFGCDTVQIDDGWQGIGQGSGENRDWYVTEKKKFPHGMKWLAEQIRARGFKPGIWLIPFSTSNEETFRKSPGLFIKNADGTSIGELRDPKTGKVEYDWTGRYIVDPTGAAGQKWFHDLFKMICDDWTYDYVKIDGQGGSWGACQRGRERLANPKLAPDEAYRAGLDAIKQVMGPKRFLLNCGGQYDSCGYCEGIRIGGDVGPNWQGMQPAIVSTMENLYKNHIAFWTDPDVLCVRPKGNNGSGLTPDQSRMWTTLLGITGQLLMTSDKMYDLPEEYVEMLRRVFPVADIRPMDLYSLRGRPRVFDLKVATAGAGAWDVVALFNWSDGTSAQPALDPADLGLEAGKYVYYDVWQKQLLAVTDGALTIPLAPTSCRLLAVRAFAEHPQLLGTSRHITQGADDLLEAKWDEAGATWSGRSAVVGGDPYELRFSLPPGWSCAGEGVVSAGPVAVLTLKRDANETVPWSAAFRKGEATVAAPTVREARLLAAGRVANLSWTGENAFAYKVFRNGEPLGQIAAMSFTDTVPRKGQSYRYEVSAIGWGGESRRIAAGEFTAAPSPQGTAKDARLDQTDPITATQDWQSLRRGKSAEGNPITIAGKVYGGGLGTHANSEIKYALQNRYQRFEAEVGVDDEKGGAGTVVFQVFADGEKVFDSGVMKGHGAAKHVSVSLENVDDLLLVVTDAGDGINCDHADWAEAKLVGNP